MRVVLKNDSINQLVKYAIESARNCYDSNDKSDSEYIIEKEVSRDLICYEVENLNLGEKDLKLLKDLWRKGHHTPFENIQLYWDLSGVSRALLQELMRHRLLEGTGVKSTRYTLKKMIKEFRENIEHEGYLKEELIEKFFKTDDLPKMCKYIEHNIYWLENENLLDLPNDKLKYYFPEALLTQIYTCINFREFMKIYELRSSPAAHFEIREMANKMYEYLPQILKEIVE